MCKWTSNALISHVTLSLMKNTRLLDQNVKAQKRLKKNEHVLTLYQILMKMQVFQLQPS